MTDNAESRVGFHWTDLFGGTGREHDEIPLIYIDDVLKRRGEPFFWRRDNPAAGRPNDEIDKSRNHALPPHKRNGTDGIDLVDMQLHTRPGNNIEFLPRRFIIGANRSDFSVTSFTQPANGRIERKKKYPNVLIYKPNDGFTGKDVFTLTLTDKEGNSLTTTGTANVENNAPTALDDTTEAWWGQTMEIFPKRNDWDVNGDAFNVVEVSAARLGKVRQKKGHPNILVYTAPAGHNDTDEFTYRMKDRFGATTTATVRVMLKEPAARENVHHTDVLRFKATVAWDKVDWKADAYRIVFVGKEKNGRIVNGINPSKNSKVVDNLDPDTEYTVRVDAKRKSGLWIEGGTTTFRTLQHTGPANVGHKDVLRVKATVTWDKVDWKAAAYRIVFIGPEKNGHIVNGIDASRSQKEVDGLEAGKTYEVRVDARRQNGAWVPGVAPGGTTKFTTKEFTGPNNVGHKDVLRIKATITWSKVDWKAAAYRIVFIGPDRRSPALMLQGRRR